MPKTLLEKLQERHGGSSNGAGDKPEVSRTTATPKQLEKLLDKRNNAVSQGIDSIPSSATHSRFAQTTGTARRAQTAYDGRQYFEQALADTPMIERIVPENITHDKHYFELHFTKAFAELCGVSSVRAVVALNSNATYNLIAQENAVVVFDPNTDQNHAKALVYAQIFALLGVWDEWINEYTQVKKDDNLDEVSPELITKRRQKLQELRALLGRPLIELLAAQTRIITTHHRKILALLMRKSFYPGMPPQEPVVTTRDEQLRQVRRVVDGKRTGKSQKKRR